MLESRLVYFRGRNRDILFGKNFKLWVNNSRFRWASDSEWLVWLNYTIYWMKILSSFYFASSTDSAGTNTFTRRLYGSISRAAWATDNGWHITEFESREASSLHACLETARERERASGPESRRAVSVCVWLFGISVCLYRTRCANERESFNSFQLVCSPRTGCSLTLKCTTAEYYS